MTMMAKVWMLVREDDEEDSEERARRGAPDWPLVPGALSLHIGWELEALCDCGPSKLTQVLRMSLHSESTRGGFLLGEMLG